MRRLRPAHLTLLLAGVWLCVSWLSLRTGPMGDLGPGALRSALTSWLEPSADLETGALLVRLRLWRVLVAGGVGASLALAGAYLQGLFRNGLASPSVVGVTAGAVLGASIALALLGGLGPDLIARSSPVAPFLVTLLSFIGALGVAFLVLAIGSRGGRLSVPTLLLAGVAANTLVAGLLAALQSLALEDFEVSRSILSWTFGTLDDRSGWQVGLLWGALLLGLLAIRPVAYELDLLGTGEEDAASLGVDVQRTKVLTLAAAALITAAAVSVAGQIAFVGLVVPHLVRMLTGPGHRSLLPLSALLGASFLLTCDLLQRRFLPDVDLRPGVTMSLIGGPVFLVLLLRQRRTLETW